jgi:hypothetical protein
MAATASRRISDSLAAPPRHPARGKQKPRHFPGGGAEVFHFPSYGLLVGRALRLPPFMPARDSAPNRPSESFRHPPTPSYARWTDRLRRRVNAQLCEAHPGGG